MLEIEKSIPSPTPETTQKLESEQRTLDDKIKRTGSSDPNPVKLHFPRTAKFELPPPQLNTTWSIFTNTLARPLKIAIYRRPAQPRRLSPKSEISLVRFSTPIPSNQRPTRTSILQG
ncbi:hypothetical protein TNIN_30171 [Trichonephila inaurata madagascariensis]|uniref:Uncharacterized protein n=1 Tax=Trichonephila inaurata madagascariensis TaxID=2747483 RepID=A0A8X7CCE8_9ARAC|nr:hypothetical protein TNIN_30171 [Trichonephila inaurata madagascariensis]